jgi:type IV pilus assembly protein PilA
VVLDRIRGRPADEHGFTLVELLIVIVILAILVAVAVPSYLSFRSKAETSAAQANVRSAISAAESWSGDPAGGNGLYTGLSAANLAAEAPGVNVASTLAVAVNGGNGYCIQSMSNGVTYDYVGGAPGAALQAGYNLAKIQSGTCLLAVGAAAG